MPLKNREAWIDVLRGVTMLLVVYGHVALYGFKGTSDFVNLMGTTRMPLFFFISGFFIYSVNYNGELLMRRLKNRMFKQLFPTLLLFTVYVSVFLDCDFTKYIFHEAKAGYWFTYVSVLYFLTLSPIILLFDKFKISDTRRIIVFLILILISFGGQAVVYLSHFNNTPISAFLSFTYFISYLKFLVAGSIFRILWIKYDVKLMKLKFAVFAALAFTVCYIMGKPIIYVCGFFGIYVALYLFYKLCSFYSKSKILNFFSFIGSMTLEIYLLHYFVINSITSDRGGYCLRNA